MPDLRMSRTLWFLALPLFLMACSNVEVLKDDPDANLSGPRFYLPRPYVVVLKPFPVAARSWLVPGTVSPEGVLISIDALEKEAPQALSQLLPATGSASSNPAAVRFRFRAPATPSQVIATSDQGGTRGTAGDEVFDKAQKIAALDSSTTGTSSQSKAPDGGTATGWIKKGDRTELRDPVNDLFEIRYLPDLEERYVLVGSAGLGSVSLDAYLTQGWMAHHYGKRVDRSALGRAVFGQVFDALDILRSVAQSKLAGATTGSVPVALGSGEIVNTSGAAPEDGAPKPCLIRITLTEMAVPGLYPILKPSERMGTRSGPGSFLVAGSLQQPASAALPVAYRTTQSLEASLITGVRTEPLAKVMPSRPLDASQPNKEARLNELLIQLKQMPEVPRSGVALTELTRIEGDAAIHWEIRLRHLPAEGFSEEAFQAAFESFQSMVRADEALQDVRVIR